MTPLHTLGQSFAAAIQDREAAGPWRSRYLVILLIFLLCGLLQVAKDSCALKKSNDKS